MGNWKKGALHTHTAWSDAAGLPEIAAYTYRDKLHYDFVCITDHNIYPDEANVSFPIVENPPSMWPPLFDAAEARWSKELLGEKIEIRKLGIRQMIKLKTFAELQKEWEIPGKFILIGGSEITGGHYSATERIEFHCNAINCPRTIYPVMGKDQRESFRKIYELYRQTVAEEKCNSIFMVNHPFWRYWDIDPQLIIDTPELKFMEICNNGIGAEIQADDPVTSPEKYWDYVLAHRLVKGYGIIYGTATDDAHHYSPDTISGFCGCDHGWVMVNCPGEMTTDNLINALNAGNFYSSCGVYLENIDFDTASRTLKIKVAARPGEKYQIRFITTKKDFNRHTPKKHFHHEKVYWQRDIPLIGEDIGACEKAVDGIEAQYTMAPDDLYVRAEVVCDTPTQLEVMFYPRHIKAWTQPFI